MADDDVGHGLSSLIPLLSGEHAQRAVDQIARLRSVASRVDAVSELCNVTRVGPLPWLGPDLIEFVRERSRNGSWWQLSAIPGLTTLLPPDELRRVIETVADEWSPRLILDCLLLAAQSRPPRWSHEDLTTRALEMIRSRLTPSEQKDALVGMIDWLLPSGAVNSGATWRPAPEARQLAPRVKRLLQLCAPAREIVEVAALRLSNDCLAEYPAETRHPLLDIDAAQLADDERSDAGATGTAPADSDERRYALLDAWSRDSDDQVNEVVTALAKLVPRPELDEALQLLVSVHSSIPGDSLRQIAARVIDVFEPSYATSARLPNVVMLLASPPLFPPTNEALRGLGGLLRLEGRDDGVLAMYRDERLPDLLREQLIIVGLTTRRSRRDGARTHSLLMEAGLLDHPSDELLGIVLREVAELPHYIGRDTDRANALSRIVWHVSPAFYGGWLKAFPWSERGKRFDALTRLESVSQMDPDTFWRHMVEALRGYGLSTDRASWLVEFVDHAPRSIYSDLLDIARSLEGDAARFVAMSALAQALDMPERRGVLLEALELARRVSNASVVGHRLVELAVDLARNDAQVLAAATATAVVLPEKRFRVSAFAALAPLLSADALAAASQAFRTIGDGPARARAMVALASSIVEPRQRARAITELVNAITALPPGNTRHAAMLFVSPLVPVNRRWPLVEEALTGGFGTATGFDRAELLDAARRALPDAPARLLRVALNWLASQAPDSTHTTASLLPYLPRWLALPAISLLAEASDKELAAQLAPHLDDLVFARAEDRAARLSENTKSALFRIKAARERRRELRNSPGAQLSAETLDRVDRITIVHDDRDRAARVTSCALDRERAMSTRAQLAEEAREIGDMPLRVSTTRYLSALAPERALPLSRDAVGGIGSAAHRAVITAHLALRFDGDARRRMLQDALAAARAEEDQALRALAGAEVGRLAPGLAREALEVLLSCDEETSARAACSMIRHMSDPDAAHAVEALRRIRSEERRAVALSEVADALGIASARAALGVAASMESAVLRGRALTDLASQLPDDCRATADALLDQITTDFAWLNALSALSKRWPDIVNEARARQACTAVIDAGDEECAAEWCQQIIPVWPASLLADLIDAVRALRDIGLRTDVLCTLVRIREDVPADAILRAAREIDDDFHRSVLLGQFAASREPLDERLAAEAIACARASGHRRRYVDALAAMSATRVIPDVLDVLLAEFSRRPAFVSSALVAIASLLTGTQARNVLRALERCRSGLSAADRMDLFLALGPRLDAADRPLAFEQLATLTERSRAQVLPELASCFDDERSIEAALAAARAITSDAFRTEALSASMAVLSEEHQRAVLSLLADTRSERERVRRLVNVMPDIAPALFEVVADYGRGLQDEDCRSALLRALDAMRTPANAERNGDEMDATADTVLGDLLTECAGSPEMILATGEASPGIPPALRLSQLVARLRTRPTLVDRADEILSAFPYLSEIAKADLLGQLPAYIDEEQQVRVLSLLGAPLSAALQRAAFDAVCRFQGLECRRRAWAALLPLLDRDMFPRLQDMWREVLQVGSVQDRPQVLAQLHAYVPLLHHRGGDAALLDSVRAISDAGSVWP